MKKVFAFSIIVLSTVLPVKEISAQDGRQVILKGTEIREIKSAITGKEYELLIQLPYSYKSNPQKKYPVVYFCDGFYDFALFTAIYGSGVYDKTIPECFLVGFSYKGANPDYETLRTFDYTHTVQGSPDSSGGAGRFLNVVESEFIPFMQKNYRVDTTFRALGGSSKGGLFTLYAMFTKTYLFDAYMAVSPAVDWDSSSFMMVEEEYYKKSSMLPVSLYMSVAEFDLPDKPVFMESIKKMNEVLQGRGYKNFRYQYQFVKDAHHSGTKPESYSHAMKFVFEPVYSHFANK